ncbi:MAG: RidA family protein, partial [Candidatus Eremiobacteraeota bacterium]|nr:RidA family protein [Candidatus Eremiobacteraeota bacterium]
GFVNGVSGFGEQPTVMNGASDVFVSVFGENGKHARAAVGAGSLPHNMSVEVDAVFEIG